MLSSAQLNMKKSFIALGPGFLGKLWKGKTINMTDLHNWGHFLKENARNKNGIDTF